MSTIQQVQSAPDYIMKFIHTNMEQLQTIYQEGSSHHGEGLLAFQCSEKDNKMDVQFMNETMIYEMISQESWIHLKESKGEKQLFFVKDIDLNSVFLITI